VFDLALPANTFTFSEIVDNPFLSASCPDQKLYQKIVKQNHNLAHVLPRGQKNVPKMVSLFADC
jgi:hypothetical protein